MPVTTSVEVRYDARYGRQSHTTKRSSLISQTGSYSHYQCPASTSVKSRTLRSSRNIVARETFSILATSWLFISPASSSLRARTTSAGLMRRGCPPTVLFRPAPLQGAIVSGHGCARRGACSRSLRGQDFPRVRRRDLCAGRCVSAACSERVLMLAIASMPSGAQSICSRRQT
jgi:hypothetical protein